MPGLRRTRRQTHAATGFVAAALLCAVLGAARARGGDEAGWRMSLEDRVAAEAQGAALILAIEAPDDEARRQAIGAIFDGAEVSRVGVERIAGQLRSIHERHPGLVFDRAELVETRMAGRISRALHVYARRPGDKLWRDLQVYLADAKPYRLRQLAFIAEVTEPVALPNGALEDPATIGWIDDYIDRLAREHGLSGSVLIAVGDRVVLERTFGFADGARFKPVTPETLFGLASASKMFTAMCVGRLVADGRLAWSDTIDKFFPDFPDMARARRTTVAQLLSHSSGIAEYWTPETTEAVRAARSTADLLALVYKAGADFEPGERHAYSNSNFVLAGLIAERAAHRPFEDLVASTVFAPAKMTHSGYFERGDETRPIAQPLVREGDGWKELASDGRGRGTAAGGCMSTARDLLRFVRALDAGEIVPRATLEEMLRSRVAPGATADADYALGFHLHTNAGVQSYGHGGIARGANAEVRAFPSLDVTLILLNNQDSGAYDDLRRNLIRIITGER